jgi:hypothetical protein
MPLSFSLTYAPPEALAAFDAGQQSTTVAPAGDMWSLGVIAYELLTGCRVFPRELSHADIRAQVCDLSHSVCVGVCVGVCVRVCVREWMGGWARARARVCACAGVPLACCQACMCMCA